MASLLGVMAGASIAGATSGIGLTAGGVTIRTWPSLLVAFEGTAFGPGIGSLITGAAPPCGAPQAPPAQLSQQLLSQQLCWQQNMPRRRLNRPQPQPPKPQPWPQLSSQQVVGWQTGWQDC